MKSEKPNRLDWHSILKVGDEGLAEKHAEALDTYFSVFAEPEPDGKCFNCGATLGGLTAAITGAGFRYGLVHGEGACGCGQPGRANHYLKDGDGEELGSLSMILLYHPDELVEAEGREEE